MAARADGHVELSVADHGPGIPEADRTRVFERFVRLDQSRSKPGFGLGLALASGVVRLHGGQMRLEDNEPGLRVVIALPIAAPSPVDAPTPSSQLLSTDVPKPAGLPAL